MWRKVNAYYGHGFTKKAEDMLFDEPTANLSPKLALQVLNELVKLRGNYVVTVMLVGQNARRTLERGDKAVLFFGGKIMFEGKTPANSWSIQK